MKLHIDEEADALHLQLVEARVVDAEKVAPGFIVDYAAQETAYLLKSTAMKTRLLEAKNRQEGISMEDVCAQLGI